jgi:hypothetical protein
MTHKQKLEMMMIIDTLQLKLKWYRYIFATDVKLVFKAYGQH